MGRWLPSLMFAGAALAATAAAAQQAPGQTALTAPISEIGTATAAAAQEAETPEDAALTGPLAGFGQMAADAGFRFRAELVNEYSQNPIGGVRQGEDDAGQLRLSFSTDLQKLVGLPGATLHVYFLQSYGNPLNKDYTGDFLKSQEVYKNAYDHIKGGILAYEQKAFNNKLDVFVGRLGTTGFYGRLKDDCYAQSNFACGTPQLLNSESNFNFPTSPTWAANVKYRFTDKVAFQTGAYEVSTFDEFTNGFYFPISHATGVTVPSELQVGDYDLTKYQYPWDFKLGGYVSTAPVSSILYNTKGKLLANYHGTAEVVPGEMRNGFYGMGEKLVWRAKGDPNKSLSLFGGYLQTLDKEEIAGKQLFAGADLRGMVPWRPHDIISGTATYINLTSDELDYLHEARVKAGGDGWNKPDEYALELDYSILLLKQTRLAPNISYIINPDNSGIPNTKVIPQNDLIFGLKLVFNLGAILGLPEAHNLSD